MNCGFCNCNQPLAICMPKGDTYVIYCSYSTSNGAPIDITGASIIMVAKTAVDVPDADSIFTISTTTGDITIPAPTSGQFVVTIPVTATALVASSMFPCIFSIKVQCGSSGGGYSGFLGHSGFSGLSGNGLYSVTAFGGTISLVANSAQCED